jgi:hypothetical protein
VDCLTRQGVMPGIKVDEVRRIQQFNGSSCQKFLRGSSCCASSGCWECQEQRCANFAYQQTSIKVDEVKPTQQLTSYRGDGIVCMHWSGWGC